MSPLLNDPFYETISVGTRVWLAGAHGHVYAEGAQHAGAVAQLAADAAATVAGNPVERRSDIERAQERTQQIEGVHGAVIAMGDRVGVVGRLPPLVRADGRDPG